MAGIDGSAEKERGDLDGIAEGQKEEMAWLSEHTCLSASGIFFSNSYED